MDSDTATESYGYRMKICERRNRILLCSQCTCQKLARQKRDFFDKVEKIFEFYIKSAKQQNNLQWEHVTNSYNAVLKNMDYIWKLKIFCAFVLKLFCTFNCIDERIIMKIIYMYYKVLSKYENFILCAYCMESNNAKHYRKEEVFGQLKTLSGLQITNFIRD